jgi:hypothetical protein
MDFISQWLKIVGQQLSHANSLCVMFFFPYYEILIMKMELHNNQKNDKAYWLLVYAQVGFFSFLDEKMYPFICVLFIPTNCT